MQPYINPKKMYLLLPLTFATVGIAVLLNYVILRDLKKGVISVFVAGGIFIAYFGGGALIVDMFKITEVFSNLIFACSYYYIGSTLIALYLIRTQQLYINRIESKINSDNDVD